MEHGFHHMFLSKNKKKASWSGSIDAVTKDKHTEDKKDYELSRPFNNPSLLVQSYQLNPQNYIFPANIFYLSNHQICTN